MSFLLRMSPRLSVRCDYGYLLLAPKKRKFTAAASPITQMSEEILVVVGGGAAGVYGAIRAKSVAPHLKVVVVEKGKPLSKVKISGGGRCNVTNGHYTDNLSLAEHYPRGHRELRGSFFNMHGPVDTMSWFSDHGVDLKVEGDGRVFPVSNSSSSIISCLLTEADERGVPDHECDKRQSLFLLKDIYGKSGVPLVSLQTGKVVTKASTDVNGKFLLKVEKRTSDPIEYVEANYLLIASGSSRQGYSLAAQLGHSIVDPVPSLFTFKVEDPLLTELAGITFPKVEAKLKLENVQRNVSHLTQVGPMLVTHWGLSGPVILRLSAWGARELHACSYKGILMVDFVPSLHIEDIKSMLYQHKNKYAKHKRLNSFPSEFGLTKRFWKYILDHESLDGETLWASMSNASMISVAHLLKHCTFQVTAKGPFKDEFVTAGGVPLSEISLKTMESKIHPRLFFAGEVLNVDGVTGGFNFQNAWSGGYIAGTSIGEIASEVNFQDKV